VIKKTPSGRPWQTIYTVSAESSLLVVVVILLGEGRAVKQQLFMNGSQFSCSFIRISGPLQTISKMKFSLCTISVFSLISISGSKAENQGGVRGQRFLQGGPPPDGGPPGGGDGRYYMQ
jgi:hypothetical protein